jgi:nitrile hydratase accessory protein
MTAPMDIEGPAAPPRCNGELVFEYPWESRAFGIAVSLYEAGVFAWSQFQAALIARIAEWQATTEESPWSYYDHWLGALTDVLAETGVVSGDRLMTRARALAERPAGHDHSH